jgi:uncharacterized protein (DUF362 family)
MSNSCASLVRSPNTHDHPEYGQIAVMVSDALHQSGLIANGLPLCSSDEKVFLLVNHVMHRRLDEVDADFQAKITDPDVIGAVLEIVMRGGVGAEQITIGNAPLQACDYSRIARESGMARVLEQWDETSRPQLMDLRGVASTWSRFGAKLAEERRDTREAVEVDLGAYSLLEPLYKNGEKPKFRVGDYDPNETDRYHARGRHIYVVHRKILESSTIISVPTLKTHQKVGMTCALKGTVGSIFLKQCLAHHRVGGPSQGGDEFSPDGLLRRLSSSLAERSSGAGTGILANARRVTSKALYRVARTSRRSFMGGAWSGNDTAWRMTLDIARILRFARPDGTLAPNPQRRHLVVIDGLVAGEGEGPLRPTARRENLVIAGSDPVVADALATLAMGWDPCSLNLIREAVELVEYPISELTALNEMRFNVDLKEYIYDDVPCLVDRPFVPPKGWSRAELSRGVCEDD